MVEAKNNAKQYNNTKVGDMVLLKRENPNKFQAPFYCDPFLVREVCGPTLVLESRDGRIFKRNVSHTRPYLLPTLVTFSDNDERATNTKEQRRENYMPQQKPSDTPMTQPREVMAQPPDTDLQQIQVHQQQPWLICEDTVRRDGANKYTCDSRHDMPHRYDPTHTEYETPQLRRSGRQSQPPAYLKDYVTN